MNMNPASILQQVAGHPVGVPSQLLVPPPLPAEGMISDAETEPAPPSVGLLAEHENAVTMPSGSDRYPGTIIDRPNEKTIVVRHDRYKLVSGDIHSEAQKYQFFEDEDGVVETYTLRKNDRWVLKGEKLNSHSVAVIGVRQAYQDPSF